MQPIRSPINKSSSQPNLAMASGDYVPNYDELPVGSSTPGPHSSILLRKRKQPDQEHLETIFEKFTQSMQASFDVFTSKVNESITGIHRDLNDVVKADLSKLTATTNEIKADLIRLHSDYSDIKKSLATVNTKHEETVRTLTAMQESMEFTSVRVDTLEGQMQRLDRQLGEIRSQNVDFADLKKTLCTIQNELHQQHQRDRKLNLEITGVPERKSENLNEIIISIAKHAGVSISLQDIDHVNRVQPRQPSKDRPKAIVVKLTTRITKDSIIAGIRKTQGISTNDIGLPGDAKPIFVNEHLTVANKLLLKSCKAIAAVKSFEYVWVKNCRIYMRKTDEAPLIPIDTEEDLKKIH